ncbi:hypothetical protein KNE206_77250 [Kitasatospora sp. NE20-6]|uniref:hypothetical protein n=1 Tax=Kitasatospora sp. NE20-6 TaxID=2859066 RepID=UPI0034DC0034
MMDESVGGQESQETQERPASGRVVRRRLSGRVASWVGAVAVVVLIAGGTVAVAVHHGFEEDSRSSVRGDGRDDARADGRGHDRTRTHRGDVSDGEQSDGEQEDDRSVGDAGPVRAPAPLPALDAADAVVKASSGVPGGKVETLRAVPATGGGRAWQAVVLGPDGVRHVVTVDGSTSTITSNTVLGD